MNAILDVGQFEIKKNKKKPTTALAREINEKREGKNQVRATNVKFLVGIDKSVYE